MARCWVCGNVLLDPFVAPVRDGIGEFSHELAVELGVESGEISTTDIARAWARVSKWKETPDGWECPDDHRRKS